jgi:hypothetical protein
MVIIWEYADKERKVKMLRPDPAIYKGGII